MAGRPDRARALLAQFDADVKDTTLRRWFEPDRHRALAEIALAEQRPGNAIEEFRRGDRRPDGPPVRRGALSVSTSHSDVRSIRPAYGFRHHNARTLPDDTLWSHAAVGGDGLHLPAVYKRLGELYEEQGDRTKAASYFAKFVELWKDADPELQPKVREARARLVRLGDTERD